MNYETSDFEPVRLQHEGDGLVGQLIAPKGLDKRPGILVMSSAMGMGKRVRESARLLAQQGYAALATDMYGNGARYEVPADAGADAGRIMFDARLLRSRVVAWYEKLKTLSNVDSERIAAIGYCLGGQCVLELSRTGADLKVVVSYHGLLTTREPAIAGSIKPLVTIYTGAKDPYAPQKDVDAFLAEMKSAQARWHLTVFSDASHSFTSQEDASTEKEGMAYDALADAVSWAGTIATLKSVL